MATATTHPLEARSPARLQPSDDSLQSRARALHSLSIDYIPNATFRLADFEPSPGPLQELLAGGAIADFQFHGSAPLGGTDVLSREVEAELFRYMNLYKFVAAELCSRLDLLQPDATTLEFIESLLIRAREIRDYLIQANMRLVLSIVKKFVTPCQSLDELLSEGTVALMQAVEKFDYDRGFRFSTYAYRAVARTAYRFVSAARQQQAQMALQSDDWSVGQCDHRGNCASSERRWNGLRDFTRTMLQKLDRRERLIIRSRFALGSHRRVRSFQDLADRLGVSKERVRQIEARALGKLQAIAAELDIDDVCVRLS